MPLPDENDDWAELARELARDQPRPPEEGPSAAKEEGVFGEGEPDVAAPVDGGEERMEDVPADPGDTEAESLAPDGQPGTGRKRRRRRRRRRRGGEQPAEAAADVGEAEETELLEGEMAEGDIETSEVGYADETEEELAPVDSESDEEAGEDLLRDLIANWNVPSWDDVVGGLYRPER